MPADRRLSRVLDQHRFDALAAASSAPKSSRVGVMLLNGDLRILGLNATYEVLSMRQRDDMLGDFVYDVFPDHPGDPQASGSSQLAASVECALRRHGTDTMPIVRYDITDPRNPEVFQPKLWKCTNTAVDDGDGQIGVLHQVTEITSLDDALSALSQALAGGEGLGPAEQLFVLSALAENTGTDRDRAQAMAREIEQLHRALETRDIIGQAKGMLMERFNVDATAAFDMLARLSQKANTPVAIVAQRLVDIDHPAS